MFFASSLHAQEDGLEHYEIVGAKLGRKIGRQISQADFQRTPTTDKVSSVDGWWMPGQKTGYQRPFSFVGAMDGAVIGSLAYSYKYQNYYHGSRKFNYRKKNDVSSDISAVEVVNVTFADEDGNGLLDKEEVAQVYFDIINTSDVPIFGITPVLLPNKTKHIIISDPQPIDTLNPKSALRYVIEISGDGKKDVGKCYLLLRINYGKQQKWDINEIVLGTKRRKE